MSRVKKSTESMTNDEFDAFMKESISSSESSFDVSKRGRKLYHGAGNTYEDEDTFSSIGKKKSFMKATSTSVPDYLTMTAGSRDGFTGVSKDSLDDEPVGELTAPKMGGGRVPGLTLDNIDSSYSLDTTTAADGFSHPGKETLEELADKDRFFRNLKPEGVTTVDYGPLLRQLDNSDSVTLNVTEDNFRRDEQRRNEIAGNAANGDMLSQVALMDSLDSTFDKDTSKPARSRLNDETSRLNNDIHMIAESTGPRQTVTTRDDHNDSENDVDNGEDDELVNNKSSEGFDSVDGVPLDRNGGNMITSTMQVEDDGSENKVTDTTMKGKTASGLDTSHDMEAIRREMRKLDTFNSTYDSTLRDSIGGVAAGSTSSRHGSTTVDTGTRLKLTSGSETVATLNKIVGPSSDITQQKKRFGQAASDSVHQQPSVRFNDQMQEYSNSDDNVVPSDQTRSLDYATPTYVGPGQPPVPASRKNRPIQLDQSLTPTRHSKASLDKKSRDKYAGVKSSGYNRRTPPSGIAASASAYSPAIKQNRGHSGTSRGVSSERKPNSFNSDERFNGSSVNSLAGFISGHFSEDDRLQLVEMISSNDKPLMASSPLKDDSRLLLDQLSEERKLSANLRVAMTVMEKDHISAMACLKADHENEIKKLKQENYVLSAKLTANSESEQRLKILAAMKQNDGADRQQLALLEKDIREQDKLIAGYQNENERLFDELKRARSGCKSMEEKMFAENQKLRIDLANVREELQMFKNGLNAFSGTAPQTAVFGANRIKHLESELYLAKTREETCKQEVDQTLQSKQELQTKINVLNEKVNRLEQELSLAHSHQTQETKEIETRCKKEVESLRQKLKWYAENQQLLDKDAIIMKQKDEEITRLKSKLDDLSTDAGKKQALVKSSQNDRSVQAKRIQDLERQVKEMENIIKKRHPNSMSALMWAASSVPDNAADNKVPSLQYLEDRIKKLERQLEEKDEEAKRSLRTVEQKYNSMKMRYEERMQTLESTNLQLQRTVDELTLSSHPHTNHMAMQRELDSVRDRYRKQVGELEQTISTLRQELNRSHRDFVTHGRSESKASLDAKDQESRSESNDHDKKSMQVTIDQLENDKKHLLDELRQVTEKLAKATSKTVSVAPSRTRGKKKTPAGESVDQLPLFPAGVVVDKQYTPDMFTGQHVSELIAENKILREKVESLELQVEERRIRLQRVLAEGELKERCLNEEFNERVTAMTSNHQQELQNILATHATEHSISKIAELASKVSTQEVVIRHLKQQLAESKVDAEQFVVLKMSQTSLETEVKRLGNELCEAKSSQSPEMRHFESLNDKIIQMETRHRLREQQLQQLMQQQHTAAAQEAVLESTKWRSIVDAKNREIDKFRSELDSILEVLRHLQVQGVVVPYRDIQRTDNISATSPT